MQVYWVNPDWKKSHPLFEILASVGIMGHNWGSPLKPTIHSAAMVWWVWRGLSLGPPRDVSFSDRYTSDHCRFSSPANGVNVPNNPSSILNIELFAPVSSFIHCKKFSTENDWFKLEIYILVYWNLSEGILAKSARSLKIFAKIPFGIVANSRGYSWPVLIEWLPVQNFIECIIIGPLGPY